MTNPLINNTTNPNIIHIRPKKGPNTLSLHGYTPKELRKHLFINIMKQNRDITHLCLAEIEQMHKIVFIIDIIQDLNYMVL